MRVDHRGVLEVLQQLLFGLNTALELQLDPGSVREHPVDLLVGENLRLVGLGFNDQSHLVGTGLCTGAGDDRGRFAGGELCVQHRSRDSDSLLAAGLADLVEP